MRYGIAVFIDIGYFFKLLHRAVGVLAEQFYNLVWMLCKAVKLGAVASGNYGKGRNAVCFGLKEYFFLRNITNAEVATDFGICFFVV